MPLTARKFLLGQPLRRLGRSLVKVCARMACRLWQLLEICCQEFVLAMTCLCSAPLVGSLQSSAQAKAAGLTAMHVSSVGLARTIYIRWYFWQGNHQYTVMYGAYIRFWPTLYYLCKHRALIDRGLLLESCVSY